MTKKHISIIIVTFNSEKYISACLLSVISNTPPDILRELIIIDNNSDDKTVKIIKKIIHAHNNISLYINKKNMGFAKAVNFGIKTAKKTKYFLLLNPDTTINKSSILNLLSCAKKNNAGISGGSTFSLDGKQNGSYFRFPNLSIGLFDFTNLRKFSQSDYWHKYFYYLDSNLSKNSCFPVDVVTGGYMLISDETIKEIGYFDERFFMYLEDIDFCHRAKAIDIKIIHCNASKIVHVSGGSSKNKDGIRHSSWIWSRKIYYFKHFNVLSNLLIQPIFIIDDMYILFNKFVKK